MGFELSKLSGRFPACDTIPLHLQRRFYTSRFDKLCLLRFDNCPEDYEYRYVVVYVVYVVLLLLLVVVVLVVVLVLYSIQKRVRFCKLGKRKNSAGNYYQVKRQTGHVLQISSSWANSCRRCDFRFASYGWK